MLEYTSREMAFLMITGEFTKVASEKVKRLAGLIKRRNSRKTTLENSFMKSNYKSLKAREKASKYNIEITRQGNVFIVKRGENERS
jgi:hypothetical protein